MPQQNTTPSSAARSVIYRRWLWLILSAAFALRLLGFWQVSQLREGFMVGDGFFYHVLAKNILKGRYQISPERTPEERYDEYARHISKGRILQMVALHEPTNYWSPGYPAFLAIVYWVFGVKPWIASLLGCLLGTLTCLLLWQIAGRLIGSGWALLMAGIWAVHPVAWHYAARLETETPSLALLLLLVYLWLRWRKADHTMAWGHVVILGVLGGILFLTRSTLGLWTASLILCFLLLRTKRNLAAAALLGITFFATILPWGFRNQASMGEFMLLETRGVNVLYGEMLSRLGSPGRFSEMTGKTEVERWREQKRFAQELIASQPAILLTMAKFNFRIGFLSLGRKLHPIFYLADIAILFCVLAGIYRLRDQWPKVGPIILFLFLNTFFVLLLLKGYESRFRMMSEWAAMICAIAFIGPILDTIFQRLKLKKLRHPGR